ncbi:uncharacterized protein LTR77_004633 [Saxophila tyrrhenica]|uniref:Xylanolytic transcriptional activator regulatory domain-containing protein n=1 Tax=Saxophila tyrrhenica TaxID=1690608 RepID=A0AAV9PH92_9PEZI|nr:hypothetical protein LTR77_004633 [Saxophila tyrrhenica]
MARTVEQMQLSVEGTDGTQEEHSYKRPTVSRTTFLNAPATWIESEERRRIFWTVFLMDRFCSVATGLTNADVHRRLPCEGALWEAGKPVRTPFFGVASRTSAAVVDTESTITTTERQTTDNEEVQCMGGFAFSIEAMENLNLVTTFFLRQSTRFQNAKEAQIWLMQFKELDIRLVRWRLFLPTQWAEASSPDINGGMDPNLVLAHLAHNAACFSYTKVWPTLQRSCLLYR